MAPSNTPKKKKTNVLHLTTLEKGGGTEHFVEAICDAVPEFEWESLQGLGAWPFSISSRKILKAKFSKKNYSAVYAYGINAQIAAVYTLPKHIPIIGVIHGEIDFQGIKDSIRQKYEKRICWWVGNTQSVLDRKNGTVIYNGILTLNELRETPESTKKNHDFGVLANGGPVKGHQFLIDLWQKYQDAGQKPPGSLVFAGNLPDSMAQAAEKAGITCLGYCDRVEFISQIKLLLIPSTSESFPTVIAESISLGVPVLANPAGGIDEVLSKYCPEAVASRALWPKLLFEPDFEGRTQSAKKHRDTICSLFDFQASCDAFLALAEEVNDRFG